MLPRCQACVLGPGTSPAPAGNRPTRWTWTPSWPGSGRARLRQPAGVPAAPGGGRVPAVPAAGGGEQRTALLATIQVASRSVMVAATHLSNKQGHNVRQLRELQALTGSRVAPRLLVGDLNMPSTVLLVASRRDWPETGRGRTFPNSAPDSAARPCSAQRPGRGHPAPRRPGGRRPRQRPPRPGGRARHRSHLTRPRPAAGLRRLTIGGWPGAARRNRSGRGRVLSG
jgi:hypothetical protein